MSTTVERSESVDNTCPVCHDVIEIFAIGQCDHPVCSRCSTRMRVLCEQMDCPICRSQMPQVAFVNKKSLFRNINLRDCIPNRKYKIFFEDKEVEDSFLELLEYRCRMPSCQNRNPDKTFAQLQTHMRRDHHLFACDLCVSHLKIFPFERKFYSRQDLAIHRRVGDKDDKSYKGHPLCEFCDERYNDTDELLKHVRKDHFFCHFCDQHGCNAYYDQYPDLMKHFEESHYLCKEGECGNASTRFTHAFTSEIDLKAHRASAHNKNLSKAQSREARTIELDFQLPRRRPGPNRGDDLEDTRPQRGRGGDRHNRRRDFDPEEADLHRAIEASKETAQTETAPAFEECVPDPVADFPALNGAVVPISVPPVQKQPLKVEDDFPSLSAIRGSKQQTQPQVKAYSTVMNRQVDTKPAIPVVRESKPVILGSVSKVVRDHPSSVPKNTEDEYPSLGGNTSSPQSLVSNNGSGNWVTKSQNKKVVVNSGTLVNNSKKQTNDKPKTSHHVDAFVKDENQFPKLASVGQQKSVLAQSVPDWGKQNGSSKKKQRAEKSYDESFELPESYHRTFEDSFSSEKTANNVKTLTTAVNKSKLASIKNPEEFPGLPVRAEKARTKDDGKKTKMTKKEKNVKTKASDNTNSCLGEIALALMQPEKNIDNGKEGIASNESQSNSNRLLLDWFDNPPKLSDDFQPKVSKANENVILTKEDQNSLPLEDSFTSNTFPNDDSSNFPSLHAMSISIQQPKPPPGFTSYPQGSSITSVSAPPGFGNQPSHSSSIPVTPPGFSLNANYIQPEDFKSRNLKLIEDIRKALVTVEEGFSNFKVLSGQFRQGLMDASTYYLSCQALMGADQFTSVFPELLTLLPDISKQQELLKVHRAATGNSAFVSPDQLSACHICGQVMVAQDVYYHQQQHASLSDFLLFNDVHTSRIRGSNGVGSDVKIKESWIKAK